MEYYIIRTGLYVEDRGGREDYIGKRDYM